jgi:hypothetical protein
VTESKTRLVTLKNAPFPYTGLVPTTKRPFLDVIENGRRGHRTRRGGVYWEDKTFSDARTLLHIPQGFDISRPGLIIAFFHGHGATLDRDVLKRQQVPMQVSTSGANAVLIAPQLAVDAADSSPGKFWEPGAFDRFLRESALELARLHGDPRSAAAFASMPVVIVAYSGGYLPAAWCLQRGGVNERLRGVVLLDALYGELDTFATWIEKARAGFFISAYLDSTRSNNATLRRMLAARAVTFKNELEPRLKGGTVTILSAGRNITHRDLLTRAWLEHPLADLLGRLPEYKR